MIETIQPYLYTFYLAGKNGSFTKAAQTLRISQSAVSVQIKKLEEILQTTLFFRKSRNKLQLTQSGEKLFSTCSTNFDNLKLGLEGFSEEKNQGTLTVNTPSFFGAYVLFPFLKIFEKKYPDIKITFQLSDDFIDPITSNVDLVIRTSSKKKPSLNYEIIFESNFRVFASKTHEQADTKVSNLKSPEELSQFTFVIREPAHVVWNFWCKSIPQKIRPKITNTLLIDNNFTQIEAVKNGLGIGLFPLYAMKVSGLDKKLVCLFPKYKIARPLYACTPKTTHQNKLTKIFVADLKDYLQKNYRDC